MRFLLLFLSGVAVGLLVAHLIAGPLEWSGIGDPTRDTLDQTGRRAKDLATTAAVRAALALQKDFALLGEIRVQTEGGVVTLTGRVATEEQRRLAELIARGVQNVRDVVNRLEVGEAPTGDREAASGSRLPSLPGIAA